jgi:hypothetical protein
MRAPLLIEQVLEETMAAIRRDSVGMSSANATWSPTCSAACCRTGRWWCASSCVH